ncbi:hypothetical protein L0668_06760 [Paraglaciecola aquimarina]|uniref:SH3b domain-containing protein n=1 Tax=Paraglaciecola algarum TaxID=3050085 RepID=A0ABS9D7L0_9ALTE|nr:hypothetical protein [Paraglaciecola sp. G1-23]MCF2947799.1 hypothetical protein [Paraglaciecola sp. G1-23]
MLKLLLLLLCVLPFIKAQAAPNDTENYYLCAGKTTQNTSWNFGTAPSYCDIDPFGDPKFVDDYLSQVIFDSGQDLVTERNRYMNELNAVIKVAAEYYLSVRKPDASDEEVAAWVYAIKTVANQETFWSHYFHSIVDNKTKMMRGDSGHGHGMMQVDDRWHFSEINQGKGWQIFENMIYAMEIFYSEWQNAEQASCVSAANNWSERTQAAYAAYNGGPTRICRWANEPVWQDEGFYNKFQAASWQLYITQAELPTEIDVECLMEGVEFCLPDYQAPEYNQNTDEDIWRYNFLTLSTGETCVLEQGKFHCIAQEQDAVCLSAMFERIAIAKAITLTEPQSQLYPKTIYDRHQCMANLQYGFSVGDIIITDKDINIRKTPAGTDTNEDSVTGTAYQILDLVVALAPVQERYYKIKHNSTVGYVFAGDYDTWQAWAYQGESSDLVDENKVIAQTGDTVYAANESGLALLTSTEDGASTLTTLANNTQLTVDDISIQGLNNQVYYHVTNNGLTGVIHAGNLLPESNLSDNISFTLPSEPAPEAPQVPVVDKPSSKSGGSVHLFSLILLVTFCYWRKQKKGVIHYA